MASTTRSAIRCRSESGLVCNPEIIMTWMLPVRYVVLVALVVWLGGMVAALFGDWLRPLSLLTAACGGIILVGLFVMKFVGPPPRAFMLRVTIAAIMLAIAVYTGVRMPRSARYASEAPRTAPAYLRQVRSPAPSSSMKSQCKMG